MANNWRDLGYDDGVAICYRPDTVHDQQVGNPTADDVHVVARGPYRETEGVLDSKVWDDVVTGKTSLDAAQDSAK